MTDRQAEEIIRRRAAETRALAAAKTKTGDSQSLPVKLPIGGSIIDDSEPFMMAHERREQAQRLAMLRSRSCVPKHYSGATLGKYDLLPESIRDQYGRAISALLKAKSCAECGPIMLLISGNVGSGKSHLACALLNDFCATSKTIKYTTATEYFLALDDVMRSKGSTLEVEREYIKPAMLVIDQMEERAETESKQRMLFRLVDERYKSDRSTIFVTNEKPEVFCNRVGDSIADRMMDNGGGQIECTWGSLRGKIAVPA